MRNDKKGKAFLLALILIFSICLVSLSFSIKALFFPDGEGALDFSSLVRSVAQLHSEFSSSGSTSNASAFVVGKEGLMLTNFHTVSLENNDGSFEVSGQVTVRFPDETDYSDVTVVGYDQTLDIAVLISPSAYSRKPFSLATSEPLYGEKCYSIGNANNQGVAVSSGMVSIPRINVTINGASQTYIQANIDIYPGSSGGCLIDDRGVVIGMSSFRLKDSSNNVIYGYGYSIPSERLSEQILLITSEYRFY